MILNNIFPENLLLKLLLKHENHSVKIYELFCLLLYSGPNLDFYASSLSENYTKRYFDAKHLKKELNRSW